MVVRKCDMKGCSFQLATRLPIVSSLLTESICACLYKDIQLTCAHWLHCTPVSTLKAFLSPVSNEGVSRVTGVSDGGSN